MTSGYCPLVQSIFWGLADNSVVNYSLGFCISVETTFTDNKVYIAQWLEHYPGMCRVQSLSGGLYLFFNFIAFFIFMFDYFHIG